MIAGCLPYPEAKITSGGKNRVALLCRSVCSFFLTIYAVMDISFWPDTLNLRRPIVYIDGLKVVISK